MLFYKIKLLLNDDIRYENTLKEIKDKLTEVDPKCAQLELYEVEAAWETYSGTRCASFLSLDEKTLEDFIEWIDDPM